MIVFALAGDSTITRRRPPCAVSLVGDNFALLSGRHSVGAVTAARPGADRCGAVVLLQGCSVVLLPLRSVTVQPAPVSNGESPQRPLER
ncbi:hypothetical protein SSCG_01567 [Streptomyces clavuligerus]|nr:hypothetical protein SSCG_01567 [Streptomyces clavuligerus]